MAKRQYPRQCRTWCGVKVGGLAAICGPGEYWPSREAAIGPNGDGRRASWEGYLTLKPGERLVGRVVEIVQPNSAPGAWIVLEDGRTALHRYVEGVAE